MLDPLIERQQVKSTLPKSEDQNVLEFRHHSFCIQLGSPTESRCLQVAVKKCSTVGEGTVGLTKAGINTSACRSTGPNDQELQ